MKNFFIITTHFLLYNYNLEYDEGLEYSGGNINNFMCKIWIVLQIKFVNFVNFEDFLRNVFCQMVSKNT